jgi:putative DNA primase/helicase
MDAAEIVARLDGVFATSNGWQARCPAHDDEKASLSVAQDGDKTLLSCQAGCETTDVLQAMGLQMRDLYQGELQRGRRAELGKPVTEYNYEDEDGELLFQIVRYSPKAFRARRRDGNGGWAYSLKGVRLVPYRLRTVLKYDWVLITEGEKDADTGRGKLGLPATTNPFGAGKWQDEYADYFARKTVVLCPHRDDAGRKHMRSVACSLFPVAKKIKIVDLPFGKDLAEFCALGGNRQGFKSLMRTAPTVTAERIESWRQTDSPSPDELEDKSIGELMAEPEQIVDWLCDGLFPAGGSSLASAKAKVGKTTTARCLAAAVARGQKFLGRKTKQGNVLYFVGVEEKAATVRHFRKLGLTEDDPVRIISVSIAPKNFQTKLEALIQRHRPTLVILDPYMRFLGIDDVNDYAKNMKALTPIVSLANKYKVHILSTGHFGKADRAEVSDQVLGSTAIFGMVDTGLFLRERQYFRTVQTKQRHTNEYGNLPETELRYDPDREWVSLGTAKEKADASRAEASILELLRQFGKPKTEEIIQKEVQGSTKLLRDALRQLVADGKVERATARREKGGRGRNPYVYSIRAAKKP